MLQDGKTALIWAAWALHDEAVRFLLESGADIETMYKVDQTFYVTHYYTPATNVIGCILVSPCLYDFLSVSTSLCRFVCLKISFVEHMIFLTITYLKHIFTLLLYKIELQILC